MPYRLYHNVLIIQFSTVFILSILLLKQRATLHISTHFLPFFCRFVNIITAADVLLLSHFSVANLLFAKNRTEQRMNVKLYPHIYQVSN